MEPHWLEVLAWIQLGITLFFLVFLVGVFACVLKYYNLEFNGFWKTRAAIVGICILWTLCLLLGRQQLWKPGDGLLSVSDSRYEGLCRAYVFLTFGCWQPLYFLAILMMLRSKARSKLQLYTESPNKDVLRWSLMWCVPVFVVHIIILALSGVHESNPIVWSTYSSTYHHCVIPLLSTGAFAVFYACFIVFYGFASIKLFTRLINRNLRYRVRWTQLFFVFFFPFEIFIRLILLFVPKYEKAFESLYHTFFFIDLIVCAVGVIEFVLMPVLDAASVPLMKGVTAVAVKDYLKSEEERNQKRRYTKAIPALERVMLDIKQEAPPHSSKTSPPTNTTATTSTAPIITKPADSKDLPKPTTTPTNIPDKADTTKTDSNNTNNNNNTIEVPKPNINLNITLTTTDIDDIFADIDGEPGVDLDKDSSLRLKLDGVSLDEFHS